VLMFFLNPQYLLDTFWNVFWCSSKICLWSPLIYLLFCFSVLLSTQNIFVCQHSKLTLHKLCNWQYTSTFCHGFCLHLLWSWLYESWYRRIWSAVLNKYCLKNLGLIYTLTYFSSSTAWSLLLYYTPVSPE